MDEKIEMLVKYGGWRPDDAGWYYEYRGEYEDAIRHYTPEKAFNLSLEIGRFDLAEETIKRMKQNLDKNRKRLTEREKEVAYGLGAAMVLGSLADSIPRLEKIIAESEERLRINKENEK